jgi:hypothetical protein
MKAIHGIMALCIAAVLLSDRDATGADISLPALEVTERTTEPLLKADKPWEDFCIGYCQVLRHAGKWQMWYAAYDHRYRTDSDGVLCYAESPDGVTWTKPNLKRVDHEGSLENNIVLADGIHGATVFIDPQAEAAERYKIVFVKLIGRVWTVFGGVSSDGIQWNLLNEPLLNHTSDTQQSCFRDGDVYRLYVRMWNGGDYTGTRLVGHSESTTFGKFPAPEPILAADDGDPAGMQFYNSAVAKLGERSYAMFPSAFYTGEDVVRVHAAVSRDGVHFQRQGRTPLVELGAGFDSRAMYAGPGAVPAEKPGDFWIYYVGSSAGHDAASPTTLKFGGGIGRFLVSVKE